MGPDQRELLVDEDAVRDFERSWSGQAAERIGQFLPRRDDQRYLATLEELVHIELELAWESWAKQAPGDRPAPVEVYLDTYPELRDEETLRRLLRQEYRVRLMFGDAATAEEYTRRFPATFPSEESFRAALQESRKPFDLPSLFDTAGGTSTLDVDPAKKVDRRTISAVGSRVGDFEIQQELGRGGMGVVYRARDVRLGRDVALKMILGGAHVSSVQLERFLVEARAAAHLQHANIVQVFEIGAQEGLPFLALEFVAGSTLANRLDGKPQPPKEAAALVETLARTIQYAHEQHILHRDLKPANILLTAEGVPKISDFGLAKQLEDNTAATKTGTVMGTPRYMSPEQARGASKEVGPASDQYSLGVILYEMLTGRPPFLAADSVETILAVLHNEPVSPRRLQPTVPVDLDTICLKTLHKEPEKRYASAADLAEDVRRFRAGEPILARPVSPFERGWRWCRRNPVVATLAAASVLLLLATTVISSWAAITLAAKNTEIQSRSQKIAEQNIEITRESDNARKQEQLASDRAAMATKAYQELITQVQDTIADTPQTQQLRMSLLKAAAGGMERMAIQMEKETEADPTLAAALIKMADELRKSGQSEQAVKLFRRVYELVKSRPAFKGESDASRYNVAVAVWSLALMDEELQRNMEMSRAYNAQALSILQEICDKPCQGEGVRPRWLNEFALAEGHQRLGVSLMRLGNSAEAAEHYLQALALGQSLVDRLQTDPDLSQLPPKYKSEIQQSVANFHLAAGEALARCRRASEAQSQFERGLRLRESALQANPADLAAKKHMGRAAGMWGEFLSHAGRLDEALEQNALSCRLAEEVAAEDPDSDEYERDLSVALYRRGVLLQAREDASASESFERCREIRQRLVDRSPANEKRRRELMLVLAHTDEFPEAARLAREFRQMENLDNEVLIDIARCLAQCSLAATSEEEKRGFREESVEAVNTVVANGYQDRLLLEQEADLKPLHGEASFQRLLGQLPSGSTPSTNR